MSPEGLILHFTDIPLDKGGEGMFAVTVGLEQAVGLGCGWKKHSQEECALLIWAWDPSAGGDLFGCSLDSLAWLLPAGQL